MIGGEYIMPKKITEHGKIRIKERVDSNVKAND